MPQNRTSIFTAVKTIAAPVVLSAAFTCSILLFKQAMVLTGLQELVSIFVSLFSSLYRIVISFSILFIVYCYFLRHPQMENNDNEDGDAVADSIVHEDFDDFLSTLSPSLSSPPMENDQEKADNTAISATAATMETAATLGDYSARGKTTSSASALRKQQDTLDQVTYGDKAASEVHQDPVFSDFSRLTNAKDIKREQTAVDGGKIKTTDKLRRITNVTKATEHHYFKAAAISDLPKLVEAKEIKKAFQNPQDTTTKHGQVSRKETQIQAEKQMEDEDQWVEGDTMEETWRAIKGATKPQEKQFKKSETWLHQHKFVLPDDEYENEINTMVEEFPVPSSSVGSSSAKELKKSMTFNDTVTIRRRGGLMREDPSMNSDELIQKCEAFIEKNYHDIRLQRQDSDQRYLDMIMRGL